MLYRPNFCCHCGEKITRAEWSPLTSRRFCDFCAVEQKQHDLLPRAAAVLILLIGAAGLTAYFASGEKSSRSEASAATREPKRATSAVPVTPSAIPSVGNSVITTNTAPTAGSVSNSASPTNGQRAAPASSSTDTVYYCGAMTKKGTPCTRRVREPGRCWQHSSRSLSGSTPD
jgi:hypothetical protein